MDDEVLIASLVLSLESLKSNQRRSALYGSLRKGFCWLVNDAGKLVYFSSLV